MRFSIFLYGISILGLGVLAVFLLERKDSLGFLVGAMQLGGGIIICGLFSFRMFWHGVIGAGILALLGAARGLGNAPGLFKLLTGDTAHGPMPLLEMGSTVICLLLFFKVIRALYQERLRRMLESEE